MHLRQYFLQRMHCKIKIFCHRRGQSKVNAATFCDKMLNIVTAILTPGTINFISTWFQENGNVTFYAQVFASNL